ncbi:MAG: PhoH family protein [Clostridia bacterium]|nr:PhoH family protein [Clostridia bacterium]
MLIQTINIERLDNAIKLFGNYDENIQLLCTDYNVDIALRGDSIEIKGGQATICKSVIEKMLQLIEGGEEIDKARIKYLEELASEGKLSEITGLNNSIIAITSRGKPVRCKTIGQKKYVQAIKDNTLVIAVGPAGTGKTYLAVALAVNAYKKKQVEKIILTRPAVEAGEKLGFLPGDMQNKVDPYLRPLYDALSDMFGLENYQKLLERQIIEVAPLAYMRGRTLSDSFIILDEAQNTTREQMKMFLTRIGERSKMVVNGDITQIDLGERTSGLIEAMHILKGVDDIDVVLLSHKDVVRQELVKNIIKAYDSANKDKPLNKNTKK